ncbi:MAG: 2OG-Fe dioxygenase family protein [Alphaproteobacteria bacterium]|nr:2OG-Fe dioxygenase family protein [Alphaproteobacteria bacterium]
MEEQRRKIDDIVDDEDVGPFTELGPKAYAVGTFEITDAVKNAFDDLPLDPYCGAGRGAATQGRHRYRRYDDFKATYDPGLGRWRLELLPHRPFIQHPKFNKAVGGIARHLEPLKVHPETEMNSIFNTFGFDKSQPIHAKIHQIRVITTKDIQGIAIAEGAHRDGQEWQIVAVFDRVNVKGGQSQFLPTGGGEPFFARTLEPGEVVCNEDAKMWHNATDLSPEDEDRPGHRDIFIVATNRWHKRRYGTDFEEASLRNGESDWATEHPDEVAEVREAS